MPTLKIRVTGMHGRDDEQRVEEALRAEPGVFGAQASCRAGCTEVEFSDGQVDIDRLIEIVEATGFDASVGG